MKTLARSHRWLVSVALAWSPHLSAKSHRQIPDPETWAETLKSTWRNQKSPGDRRAGYLGRMLILASTDSGGQTRIELPTVHGKGQTLDLENSSFLELTEPNSAKFSFALNPVDRERPPWSVFLSSTRSDAVLWLRSIVDKNDVKARDWHLMTESNSGSVERLHVQPAPVEGLTAATLASFVRAATGYDAVVLIQNGDLVLAQTPDLRGRASFSAEALPGTHHLRVLRGLPKTARENLTLLRGGRRHSVFRAPSERRESILVFGTKLIF